MTGLQENNNGLKRAPLKKNVVKNKRNAQTQHKGKRAGREGLN